MGWKKHPPSDDDGLESYATGCITWPAVWAAIAMTVLAVRWI